MLLALAGAVRAEVAEVAETPQLRMIGASGGLPSSDILGLGQDRAGYLWIATMDGLARHDGVDMDVWRHDPEDPATLPENRLQSLHIAADDRIWVGTVAAGAAVLDATRQGFTRYDRARFPAMRSNLVLAITSEPGAVWLGTADGLYRIATSADAAGAADGDIRAFVHDPEDPHSLPGRTVINMDRDARGRLWLATTGGLARVENGRLQRMPLPEEPFPVVYSATVQADGTILVGSANGVFVGNGDDEWRRPAWSRRFARPDAVIASVTDPGGGLWLGSQRGAWRVSADGIASALLPTVDAVSVPVQSLFMQPDGALWVPVFGQGLGYLRPDWRRLMQFHGAGELGGDRYRSLAPAAPGGVWMLARNGAVERLTRRGVVERLDARVADAIAAARPLALAADADGGFWIGAPGSVLRVTRGGAVMRWEHTDARDPALPGLNRLLLSAPAHMLWIGNAMHGLQLRDARTGRVLRSIPADGTPGFDLGDLEQMDIGTDGALWLAGADGLARMDADGRLAEEPALRGERVLAFGFDGADALWLFRRHRLQRFEHRDGRWEHVYSVGAADGLPALTVGGLRVDARHRVWLSSPRGLYRWNPAGGRIQHIGVQNGLRSQEFAEGVLALDADGLLVAATIDGGVVAIDTRLPDPPVRASPLHVKSASVWRGGQWHARDVRHGLTLAPDESEFRIGLRLLDYADPASNRYWFRLDGHDADWVEQGSQGERVFSGVPPGDYRLHLRAHDAAGHAADGPVLAIHIRAPWWATASFRALLLALAAAAALALAALYRRHLTRRNAWQLARAERELAEHASLAKTRFLATLGHEVRTPMTGVLGMGELLLGTPLTPEQRTWAQSIQHAGQHLLRLVNDALDLARIESGRLELERQPFDIHRMLDDIAALQAPLAQARGLAFAATIADQVPRWLLGDCGRVRQIVLNLIGNAIKFTEHGSVTLHVEPASAAPAAAGAESDIPPLQPSAAAPAADGSLPAVPGIRILISDTGPGLNPGQVERLFRRFEQADGARTAARYGGSGLGLAISQELAAAMGGRIGVTSTPGAGTRFVVELPLPATAATEPAPASAPRATRLPALHLLLVEDDATVAAVVSGLLRAQGHQVIHAGHGLAALAETASQRFDLAFLDLDLPGIDGLHLAGLLREQGFGQPLIALTARSDAQAEPAASAAGFVRFVRKPVTGSLLMEVMEQILLPAVQPPGAAG